KQSSELALEHINHARQLAQEGLEEARLSVRALRPESLHADFHAALEALARRAEETGAIHGRLSVTGVRRPLPAEVEAELLRIAQESVTNVLKHAQAREVRLGLDYGPDSITLSIADDGTGFDPKARHEGFGLLGMRERAQRLDARLAIRTEPGDGTTVSVAVGLGAAGQKT
ncbi:MAG: ATP-binding protein, partial [Variovorax sp.]